MPEDMRSHGNPLLYGKAGVRLVLDPGDGQEAGNVVALGFLGRISLPGDLGGIVECGQRRQVLRSLLFQRQNVMS